MLGKIQEVLEKLGKTLIKIKRMSAFNVLNIERAAGAEVWGTK